jgi:hypothetical protein
VLAIADKIQSTIDDVLRELEGLSHVLEMNDIAAKREGTGVFVRRVVPVRTGYEVHDMQAGCTPLSDRVLNLSIEID